MRKIIIEWDKKDSTYKRLVIKGDIKECHIKDSYEMGLLRSIVLFTLVGNDFESSEYEITEEGSFNKEVYKGTGLHLIYSYSEEFYYVIAISSAIDIICD